VQAPQYHETLFSQVYPGKQDSGATYIPVLKALEDFLRLPVEQKQRTVLRTDSGFGGDDNVDYALSTHWQVLTKGKGGRRPSALARRIPSADWHALGQERWVAQVSQPPSHIHPTQCLVLCWQTPTGKIKYATLVCSVLAWNLREIVAHYDDRGQCETEIQADKGGLKMERRRKKRLAAQEAMILLTDLAHNLLAWTSRWMFPTTDPLADFGTTRLIEDVLCLPGRLIFQQNRLVEAQLNQRHPYANQVAAGLERLLAHFGHP
jgi:hypothetical protein